MDILQQFMTYAGEFEKTLADDDWKRLRPYFGTDAIYEVKAPSFACRLTGPDAIFAGMKKSLDGFDRRFTGRSIEVTSGPTIEGEELRMGWAVTYNKDGWTTFVLSGSSLARYRDGKIVYLCDTFDPSIEAAFLTWQQQNGVRLDPSYT